MCVHVFIDGFFSHSPCAEGLKLLHVSLVVAADLLDADVVLGVHVGLGGGVRPGQGHHADDVLEVLLVFNFDLWGGGGAPFISQRLILSTAAPAAQDATGISHSRDAGIMRRVWTQTLPQVAMKYITSPPSTTTTTTKKRL